MPCWWRSDCEENTLYAPGWWCIRTAQWFSMACTAALDYSPVTLPVFGSDTLPGNLLAGLLSRRGFKRLADTLPLAHTERDPPTPWCVFCICYPATRGPKGHEATAVGFPKHNHIQSQSAITEPSRTSRSPPPQPATRTLVRGHRPSPLPLVGPQPQRLT